MREVIKHQILQFLEDANISLLDVGEAPPIPNCVCSLKYEQLCHTESLTENWDSEKLNGNRGLHSSQGTPLCKTASSPKTITRRVQQGTYMGVPLSNRGQGLVGDIRGTVGGQGPNP